MARGPHLFIEEGETKQQAQRRENAEAPHGRCGDIDDENMQGYPGCGVPLSSSDEIVCYHFPDCCRP